MTNQRSDDDQELARFAGTVLDLYEDDQTYRPELARTILEAGRLAAEGQGHDFRSLIRQSEDDLWKRWQGSAAA